MRGVGVSAMALIDVASNTLANMIEHFFIFFSLSFISNTSLKLDFNVALGLTTTG
ncbi:hypothetical protein YPC_2998 [Yersinia pestis biovar Medievalis str. Harbin 35]|nr:hypothetical protein YPC_2998 [Yersinia pestis biovar Medievalis str. Harbin 35]